MHRILDLLIHRSNRFATTVRLTDNLIRSRSNISCYRGLQTRLRECHNPVANTCSTVSWTNPVANTYNTVSRTNLRPPSFWLFLYGHPHTTNGEKAGDMSTIQCYTVRTSSQFNLLACSSIIWLIGHCLLPNLQSTVYDFSSGCRTSCRFNCTPGKQTIWVTISSRNIYVVHRWRPTYLFSLKEISRSAWTAWGRLTSAFLLANHSEDS